MTEQQEPQQESPKQPKVKKGWQASYGDSDGAKGVVYSRSARNSSSREATTMSKALLVILILMLIVPALIFLWISANRGNQSITARTAEQVVLSREQESQSVAETSSSSTDNVRVTTAESTSGPVARPVANANSSSSSRSTQTSTPEPADEPTYQEPEQTYQPPTGGSYVVATGDSWYAIAVSHGVDVYQLAAANGASIDTPIHPGETIIIP